MFDANGNPIAQGQQQGTETPNEQSTNGVQSRIDELTREKHEARRQADELREQINALLMAQMSQAQRPTHQEPEPQIDPEERRRIQAAVTPEMKALQNQVAQMQAQMQAQQFQQFQNQVSPEVFQNAQALKSQWQKAGFTGWSEQDAIVYAQGQAALRQAQAAQQRQVQQWNNGAVNNVNMQQGFAPAPTSQAPRMPDFSQLPLNQRLEAQEQWMQQNADKLSDEW